MQAGGGKCQLWRNRRSIAHHGRCNNTLHVLIKQVALRHQLESRCAYLGGVVVLVPVALGERSARVASRVTSSGANQSVSPFIGTICSGDPVTGSRGFHPVCVPTGTVMSGMRTPAVSLPSPSTAATSAG